MNILSYNNDTFKITCNRVVLSYIIPDSSMVEHTAVNRGVVGSSPTRGVFYGPMVKRLRHRPFTAVTRVRFPSESFKDYMPMWLNWQSS